MKIKKMIGVLFAAAIMVTLVACGQTNQGTSSDVQLENDPVETSPEETEDRVLVAYFSATGTTARVAGFAADYLDADVYEITPVEPYTSDDLNYNNTDSRASIENSDPGVRPAIANQVENIAQYDTVVLAYPIWWGQAPKIISTFLESYDFSDKTIVPLCTSGSSGIGSSANNLHSLCPDSTSWLDGERFSSGAISADVEQWLSAAGFSPAE